MAVVVRCANPECGARYSVNEHRSSRPLVCRRCGQKLEPATETLDVSAQAPAEATFRDPRPAGAWGAQPRQLGRFQIRLRLGAGAFGAVYRAFDPQLERDVALKVPHAGVVESAGLKERFLREAKAAAQLRHPHIVPVYDAGQEGECAYIASAFVEGETLEGAARREPLDFRRAADVVRKLAEALDYAHALGVVHRDVKPANVLLDRRGEPHLMDFGLARLASDGEKLTFDGAILGTPAYMAPEQARGGASAASPACDQYALGVMLYEMMCGQCPFSGPPEIVIFNAIYHPPPAPTSLNPRVPRDLETICLKAMSKDPAMRYATCAALADDLRRWLDGEPIRARRLSVAERLARWCRRQPLVASLTGATVALTAAIVGTLVYGYSREFELRRGVEAALQRESAALADAEEQRDAAVQAERRLAVALDEAETARLLAESERENAERERDAARAARQSEAAARAAEAEAVLTAEAAQSRTELERRTTQRLLAESCLSRGLELCDQGDVRRGILWLAQGVVVADDAAPELDHVLRANIAWFGGAVEEPSQAAAQSSVSLILEHSGGVNAVACSPDAGLLVTAGRDATARIWQMRTGEPVHSPLPHDAEVTCAAFSPDSTTLATGDANGLVRLWKVDRGELIGRPLSHGVAITGVAFSQDGSKLVTSGGRSLGFWHVSTGRRLRPEIAEQSEVAALALSPNDAAVLTGTRGIFKRVRLWNSVSGEPLGQPIDVSDDVTDIALGPGARSILIATSSQDAGLWSVATGEQDFVFRHQGRVTAVALSPDRTALLTASEDRTVRLWDAESGKGLGTPFQHDAPVADAIFAPDGTGVVTATRDGTVRFWTIAREGGSLRRPVQEIETEADEELAGLAFTSDGRYVVAANGRAIGRWDAESGQRQDMTIEQPEAIRALAAGPDAKLILTGSDDGTGRLWNLETGERVGARMRHDAPVVAVAISADGTTIATSGEDRMVRLWDTRGELVRELPRQTSVVRALAFRPDGTELWLGGEDGTSRIWSLAPEGASRPASAHADAVRAAVFGPSGMWALTGSADRTARLWDVVENRAIGLPLEHRAPVTVAAHAGDGRVIVTGSFGSVNLWDTRTQRPIGRFLAHNGTIRGLACHPDGQRLAVADDSGRIRIWQVATSLAGPAEEVRLWAEVSSGMVLEPDGSFRVLDAETWAERRKRWEATQSPAAD